MRVGIIAAAGADPTPEPRLGERDALLVRSRLELEDVGFQVTIVDPNVDLAEQLDALLATLPDELDDLVFYASCLLAVVDDGECYLCLDPDEPDVGDALRDVAKTLAGRARHGTLFALDLRLDDPEADRNLLTEVLANVQDCVESAVTGVELIAAVRPIGAHIEKIPSRLTAGLLEAIDEKEGMLTARQAYATAIQTTDFGSWPNALCYAQGRRPLHFVPSEDPPSEEPITEEPPTARPPEVDMPVESEEPSTQPKAPKPEPTSEQPPTPRLEAPVEDLTPTTPRIQNEPEAQQVVQQPKIAPPPPSERRIAHTTSVPTHLKPSAPSSLPKVMLGKKASRPAPDSEAPPPPSEPPERASRPLLKTMADGPDAKRIADARSHVDVDVEEQGPMTQPQGSGSVRPSPTLVSEPAHDEDDYEDISIEEEVPQAPPPAPSKKRPSEMTVDDHISAGDLARSAGRDDEALSQFKKALAKLGTKAVPQRAEVYIRIGQMSRVQGKTRVAISNFDKALNISPGDRRALSALIELNAEAGNWRGVAAAEDKFFSNLDEDDPERVTYLLKSGDLWREGAQDNKKAKKRYDAARALAPKEVAPLERLLLIHEADGALEQVLDLRRRVASLTEDPRRRAETYFALGAYCVEQGRDEDAYNSYELALDADPTFLQALTVLSNALAEEQEWGELERVYEKMVSSFESREPTEENVTVLAELHHRSALLHRDHLEDPARALESLTEELALRPDQLSTRILAADLAIEIDDKDAALDHLRFAAGLEPKRAETYHQVFGICQRHDDVECAFLAASAAMMLEAADDRERIVFREHRVEGVPALHNPLDGTAWEVLKGDDHDASVDAIMRSIAPAVLRTRIKQLQTEKKLPSFPDEAKQDLDTSTISAVRSLGWACQFLGVPAPIVYIDEASSRAMSAPFAKQQTTVIGKGALRGRSLGELAFLAGQHAALRLPEHELVAHLRSSDELTACFLAALTIVLGKTPVSGEQGKAVEALAATYAKQQTNDEREALIASVEAFSEGGGRVNIRSWIATVERCSARAGLLLCGDLETSARLISNEGDGRLVTAGELLDDLAAFTISAEHVWLRQALGMAL